MNYDHSTLNTAQAVAEARDGLLARAKTLTRSGEALTGPDLTAFEDLTAEIEALNERHAVFVRSELAMRSGAVESGDGIRDKNVNVMTRTDPHDVDALNAPASEIRSRALSAVEKMNAADDGREHATRVVENNGSTVGRWAVAASRPAYTRAFEAVLRDPVRGHLSWTAEETDAYREVAALEQRLGSTSDSAGGYAIPVHLDPVFVLSSAGSTNPFRQISRVEQLAEGGTWNGVTTAGVTGSWDTEGAEVSDDAPTLARAAIPVFRLAAFVGASFELIDDVPGLGVAVSDLFRDSVDQLEATAFATGNGTSAPQGIVTALAASAGTHAVNTTNSVISATDLFEIDEAVAPRFQDRSTWVMNRAYVNRIRAFGDTDYFGRTATLAEGPTPTLLGQPLRTSSAMTSDCNTSTNNWCVSGDFSQYVVVDKVGGSRVSYIPHLFGASGRPTGQAGWHLYKRTGAEPTTTAAFVLGVNPAV